MLNKLNMFAAGFAVHSLIGVIASGSTGLAVLITVVAILNLIMGLSDG